MSSTLGTTITTGRSWASVKEMTAAVPVSGQPPFQLDLHRRPVPTAISGAPSAVLNRRASEATLFVMGKSELRATFAARELFSQSR
jgi:hypothetical protein